MSHGRGVWENLYSAMLTKAEGCFIKAYISFKGWGAL